MAEELTEEPKEEVKEDAQESDKTEKVDDKNTEPDAEVTADEKPKPDPRQKKIAKLSYENREQKRRIDRLLDKLEDRPSEPGNQPNKPPKIEDYDTLDDYLDARDKHRSKPEEPKKDDSAEFVISSRDEMIEVGDEKYEDFSEVVFNDNVKITPAMRDAIFSMDDTDVQAEVAYYLGKNRKEVTRISRLSPIRQITEIGKLEVKLSDKPTPKRPSKAPAPIEPLGGGKTSSSSHGPNDDMATFIKKRNKELGRG